MLKETGYQEKFEMLKTWLVEIIDVVKRDLKNEHLKIDRDFCKRYFLGKNIQHVTAKEIASAYEKDIAAGNVGLAEFIASRWLLKNTDIYGYFEKKLKPIEEDFDTIDSLPMDLSLDLMEHAVKQFGPTRTYLFSVLNSVVFPQEIYDQLEQMAKKETATVRRESAAIEEANAVESITRRHDRELAAVTDRFEKKLSGMQRKYLNDMEALKKQVSTLQKKLLDQSS